MLRYLVRRLLLLVPILFGFSLLFGVPLGFFAAKRYGGIFDNVSLIVSLLGISVPIFFLAIILKYLFAIKWPWLPSVGRISVLIDMKHPTNFYVLDAIIERNWHALRDVLRNALLPVTTIVGLQTGLLLSGAVLTETVFAYPGMGSWLRDAIFARDYPVLQGGILFLAFVFVMVNLIVDISYAIINPRIRYS